MMMPARRLLPLCILVLQSTITFADFGDYVDPTFDCPAMTTCTQVCVETVEDCPVEMQCSENKMLCADGSCATFCDPNLVSPCERSCAPVACPKLIAPYEVCRKNFTSFYEYANNCEVELHGVAVTESDFTWTDPAFLFCYAWVIGVSAGIVLWCWYK